MRIGYDNLYQKRKRFSGVFFNEFKWVNTFEITEDLRIKVLIVNKFIWRLKISSNIPHGNLYLKYKIF